MSGVVVSCPACGGQVRYPVGSAVVAVCPYCRSVVARGDQRVEDLGKVAVLTHTDSVLAVGVKGRYKDVPFELTGRAQLAHPAGGVWDEWYAAFVDGRWGWLAEAQGRFYLTFEDAPGTDHSPPFDELQIGTRLRFRHCPETLTVTEKSHAKAVSAEGAMPYRLTPGVNYFYADLSGPSGEFATLDYAETPPQFFLGREVTAAELGVPGKLRERETATAGVHLNCPHCAGALQLRAPDKTERVVCPSCGSLLDVSDGKLRYLNALKPAKVKPAIPLGSTGRFHDHAFLAIGWMQRSVKFEGTLYFWEEYLLYEPHVGFRWLVCSDGHWNFVEPVPPGAVRAAARTASWNGKDFKIYQQTPATVEHVLGEFYWKVSVGEKVQASDFIAPPEMLSREVTKKDGEGEVNWSHGTYTPAAEVQKAFGLASLPRPDPFSVAPNQPFKYRSIYLLWGVFTAAAVLLLIVVMATRSNRQVFEQTLQVHPSNDPEKPEVVFTEPFELRGGQNIRVTVSADVNNSWLGVEGDLIKEDSDLVQPFSVEVSYYSGVEDGEAWTEGSRELSVHLSALPGGKYSMRLEMVGDRPATPPPAVATMGGVVPPGPPLVTVHVVVEQGVGRFWTWLVAVLALAVLPILVGLYHFWFERKRWADSAFSPFHSGS